MTGDYLFIGTSFLGAIQQGWKLERGNDNAGFVGLNAPAFAHALDTSWSVTDEKLTFREDLNLFLKGFPDIESGGQGRFGIESFSELSAYNGLSIDLATYHTIIFVDMFFRPVTYFRLSDEGYPTAEGQPISRINMASLELNGFMGGIKLVDHARFGSSPYQSIVPKLREVRDRAPNARIGLISSPRPLQSNLDLDKRFGDTARAKQSFDYIDRLYDATLAEIGITYIYQPTEVLDEHGCLTLDKFSRGPHIKKPGTLDPHLNGAYGQIVVQSGDIFRPVCNSSTI